MSNIYEMNKTTKFLIEKNLLKESDWKLGRRIREARKLINKTQLEFSEMLGISNGSLQNYECGKQKPTSDLLRRIVRKCEINAEWLLLDQGTMQGESVKEIVQDGLEDFTKAFTKTFSRMFSAISGLYDELGITCENLEDLVSQKTQNLLQITTDLNELDKLVEISIDSERRKNSPDLDYS